MVERAANLGTERIDGPMLFAVINAGPLTVPEKADGFDAHGLPDEDIAAEGFDRIESD